MSLTEFRLISSLMVDTLRLSALATSRCEYPLSFNIYIFLVVRFWKDARTYDNFFKFFHTEIIQVFGFK